MTSSVAEKHIVFLGDSIFDNESAASAANALKQLAAIRAEFQSNYTGMLAALLNCGKPFAVCTVYDPCFPDPLTQRLATTVLNIVTDCILSEAIGHGLTVIATFRFSLRTPPPHALRDLRSELFV